MKEISSDKGGEMQGEHEQINMGNAILHPPNNLTMDHENPPTDKSYMKKKLFNTKKLTCRQISHQQTAVLTRPDTRQGSGTI